MKKNFEYLLDVYKYSLSKKDLFSQDRSVHWDKKFEKNDKFFSLDNVENFRKNTNLSDGLDDSANLQNKLDLLDLLDDDFDHQFLRRTLPEKNIGNSNYSKNILGYYVDYGIIHHLKWYEKIEKYITPKSTILEIGGGFGSLARIIIKNKNVKYFLIDLPEANLISNYYLKNNFPEKKILNFKEFKFGTLHEQVSKYDIFILPPNVIDKENINFDFIINTRSFMEMNKKIIKKYFELIHNKLKNNGLFLNINKYSKSTVGENINFYEYPYDVFWDVIISEESYLQNNMIFLLTKRKKQAGQILQELENIKNQKKSINKKNIYYRKLQHNIKKIILLILKKFLILVLGKKNIKKISRILMNFIN